MLAQKPSDKNKIYFLHEPHVYCIAKGKAHKKYECYARPREILLAKPSRMAAKRQFGTNASIAHD